MGRMALIKIGCDSQVGWSGGKTHAVMQGGIGNQSGNTAEKYGGQAEDLSGM